MGSGASGAPIYLLGKELTTHYQSSFVALYRILPEFLQGWCTPVLCFIIFLVADHWTTSTTLSRIWCVVRTLRESQTVLALLSHPKRALPRSSMCSPPNFLMTSIPRRRSNHNGFLFTTSTFVFKGFLLVTVKVMLPTPWLRRHFLPVVRIAVHFRTSGRHNIPLTTDEEQPESTNAIRSIPLTFTFIIGSTSSSLCGERVVPTSRPLPRFLNTSIPHVLVACSATAFCLSGVEEGPTGTRGRTRSRPAVAATGSSTSNPSTMRARALARICSRVMCSILEDPRNCRLTGPESPDMKAQLSHRSVVFSSIRRARSCRSPKYLSTVSPGYKRHKTNVSNATKGFGEKPRGRLVLPAVNPRSGHGLTVGILTEPCLSARVVEHVQRCQHHTFRTPALPVPTVRTRPHEIRESAEYQTLCLPFASGYTYTEIASSWFQKSRRRINLLDASQLT